MNDRLRDAPKDIIDMLASMHQTKPMLGADPEFFVVDGKNKILASDNFFPGKNKPIKVSDDGLTLFFDGIQAEFNLPPTTCRETLCYYTRRGLSEALSRIKNNKIKIVPSVKMTKAVINSADPEARRFGCMPDFNAYTLGQNTPEIDASHHMYRYAGGHIHIGLSSKYINKDTAEYTLMVKPEGHIRIIKTIDYFLGVILVLLDRGPAAVRRRSMYGKAGCFRPTPYGIEYRTPSCWWMRSPASLSLAFGLARLAWALCLHPNIKDAEKKLMKELGYSTEDARGIIDESDLREAKKFWKKLRPYLAVMSNREYNPVNIKATRSVGFQYISPKLSHYELIKQTIAKGELLSLYSSDHSVGRNSEKDYKNAKPVFGIAALDYVITNGVNDFITDDLHKEWYISNTNNMLIENGVPNGWISHMYKKLAHNKDFQEYQINFLKNVL